MTAEVISADDLRYISELLIRLPNMHEIHKSIVDEARVDGDGGAQPFQLTFDIDTHYITLQFDMANEYWGASAITKKEN